MVESEVENEEVRHELLLEGVKQAVLADVDLHLAGEVDRVRKKLHQAVGSMCDSHDELSEKLFQDLAECSSRQASIEADHHRLNELLIEVYHYHFAMWSMMRSSLAAAFQETGLPPEVSASAFFGGLPSWHPLTASLYPPVVQEKTALFPSTQKLPTSLRPLGHCYGDKRAVSLAEALDSEHGSPQAHAQRRSFEVRLDKAAGTPLGMEVVEVGHSDGSCTADKALQINSIAEGSLVEEWNQRQCAMHCFDQLVVVGDCIVSVNGVDLDPPKMLEECSRTGEIKLLIYSPYSAELVAKIAACHTLRVQDGDGC